MSDLPSINDLISKGGSSNKPILKIASEEVEEKFKKKISAVDIKDKEREARKLAFNFGLPHIDLEKFPISQEALRQISLDDAKKNNLVCFYSSPDEIKMATTDPKGDGLTNILVNIEHKRGFTPSLYVVSEHSLEHVLKLYNTLPIIKPITKDVEINTESLEQVKADVTDFKSFQDLLDRKSTTDLVTLLLGVALKLEASDLHIEAEEEKVVIRIRLDGILHDAAFLEKELYKQLISRLKLVSGLKINITDNPQDGRFTIKLPKGNIDVRVSTIPTVWGESVVMRLLDQSRKGLTFEALGLSGDAFDKLKEEIDRPNGMIITTGPTGSGKTTTLYSILTVLNKSDVKIITLEDPVEYKLSGINQSQIDHTKDYTFAKGLRSILRQDPDIVMVGEIRDLETADTAIQGALTGHLILSTIHTNSAAGAVPRFVSMGVKPFLLAPSLNTIMGQRLVRRVCQKCKTLVELSAQEKERVMKIIEGMPDKIKNSLENKELNFYIGKGCEACSGIGYKGQIGIYEVLQVTPQIQQMILSGQVLESDIEKKAIEDGMVTMVQDGVLKSLDGLTSLEEVFRVIE